MPRSQERLLRVRAYTGYTISVFVLGFITIMSFMFCRKVVIAKADGHGMSVFCRDPTFVDLRGRRSKGPW